MKSTRLIPLLLSAVLAPAWAQITLNPIPTRVLGQDAIPVTSFNPNLVEGREFDTPEGIALDTSTNPPALYVSDYLNNRVLGFRNASGFANGQAADLVLGQPDFVTTFAQGPGTSRSIGLSHPTGIAVDASGNVYIVDSANNRILRFPQPFSQLASLIATGSPVGGIVPDMVIGHSSFSTKAANQGGISASSLSFVSSSGVLQAFLTFDSSGNLWVADSGNNRILRFNASTIGSQASSGPAADLVLGQSDFVTGTYTPSLSSDPALSLTAITTPNGIAFDAKGRLFVDESVSAARGRILMWTPPFSTGQPASALLTVDTDTPQPPAISEFQLGTSPGALFAIGNSIGVADPVNNRILVFPPVEQWNPDTTYQAAVELAGQADFASGKANRAQPATGPDRLSSPGAAVFYGSELYIADSFNNRVVVLPQNGTAFGSATRVLGQDLLTLNSPNLVEGKEFNFGTGSVDAGITVDLNSNPPHLYIADTHNNRVLGYNDLRNFKNGAKADIVIGQPDFQQTLINNPSNDPVRTTDSGLALPTGIVIDTKGNLYVADTGNGRVLRFPQPFTNYVPGLMEHADLVLGQTGFSTTKITDATSRTMAEPYGVAFTLAGGLLVSDVALNRVLYFPGTTDTFKSGMSASIVFGQPDFNSGTSGSDLNQLSFPRHISSDSDDRLYVADSGNHRVAIYDHAPTATSGQAAAQVLTNGLSSPRGVYVSNFTGDIWVADASAGAVRYPAFNQLIAAGGASNAIVTDSYGPLAVVEDAWGDLFLADAIHRVTLYYPGLSPINAANFLHPNVLAPGMIAALYSQGNANQFGGQAAQASALPLPTQLNGVQVLFNGSPVPLFYADANQINFQVPIGAPQGGFADLQVLQVATGRILGDTTVVMTTALPGIFTHDGNGIGPASALNQDNTVNSSTNQAAQGTVITLFGTGQGFVTGAPPDGTVSNAPVSTASLPLVIMGTDFVPQANIRYFGLSPALVGVWQLNVLIPDTVITTPTNPTQVVVLENSVASGGGGTLGRPVIIYVKSK